MPGRPTQPEPSQPAARQGGFTILELMVVVVILGLTSRIVFANIGTWIPKSAMDSQANQLRAHIDYLRSEAKIQGKPYRLEFDLEKHRYRLILPQEDLLAKSSDDTAASSIPMNWTPLDEHVEFDGYAVAGGLIQSKATASVDFDEQGFSADQTLYLRYKDPNQKMLWSIHLYGLSGTTRVVHSHEGKRDLFPSLTEADF